MKKVLISPSILGVEKKQLIDVVDKLILSSADYIHFDVMDGKFVNNLSFNDDEIDILSNHVNDDILDVHLMCYDLKFSIDKFAKKHVKYISIHYESDNIDQLIYYANYIRELGIKPGLVINPDTDVNLILNYLSYFDLVLVMSVYPGKGGQTFMDGSLEKIRLIDQYRKAHKLDLVIEVDGGINDKTGHYCIKENVDILVAGSYILKSDNYKERIESLK